MGIYEGFAEIHARGGVKKLPRLIAVEPVPRLKRVMEGEPYTTPFTGDYRKTPSIGTDTATYQSCKALRDTDGIACAVPPEAVENAVRESAGEGIYLENSAAVGMTAVKILREQGRIGRDSTVVMLATSHGFKNEMERNK